MDILTDIPLNFHATLRWSPEWLWPIWMEWVNDPCTVCAYESDWLQYLCSQFLHQAVLPAAISSLNDIPVADYWCHVCYILVVYSLFQERTEMSYFISERPQQLESRFENFSKSISQQYGAIRQHLVTSLHSRSLISHTLRQFIQWTCSPITLRVSCWLSSINFILASLYSTCHRLPKTSLLTIQRVR